MYEALRQLLFRMDPERAHHLALRSLRVAQSSRLVRGRLRPGSPSPRLCVDAFGARFPAPLGMAAGFDKEAVAYNALLALGFGHVEVGTVTPRPQSGNPKPRMQRLPEHRALVNRLGFPGPGAETVAARLARRAPEGVVGVNVGPNKTTKADQVVEDVQAAGCTVAPHAGFLAINVSSPNTPGLRALQTPDGVAGLVTGLQEALDDAGTPRPVLLKLHPDAPDEELVRTARAAVDAGAAGIVAVNTTRDRPADAGRTLDGGLSGAPLQDRAVQAVRALHHGLGRDTPLVGVGGIATGEDALRHIQAGASLVQAYTGFIYGGPGMPAQVHGDLVAGLDRLGLDRIEEAVGTGAPPSA